MSFDDGWEEHERGDDALAAEVRRETLAGLDLNDPEVENYVADAIQRLHPDGWVPLSRRYPWRFPEAGRCGAQNPYGPPQLSCDLRAGHTGQHETPWREGRAYWEQL